METLFRIDGQILLWIQENIRQDWMTPFWEFITSLGDKGWFWIALSLCFIIPKKTRNAGIAALLSIAVGALFTNAILKELIARTRPYEVVEGLQALIPGPKDFSFPSGHTCASFSAAFTYYRTLPRRYGCILIVLAVLIAFSRLYVGVHYPTDILGGLLIGFAASKIVQAGQHLLEKGDQEKSRFSN